jgi:nucleoside-diphosphate-sugar epimerase
VKRVLVTGARGFIGRQCLPRLTARGFDVHAVSSGETSQLGASWHRCDLLNGAQAVRLLERLRPTHLLHLGWIAQPGIFWTSRENLAWLAAGTELVRAFYDCGGTRAVGVGSCAEYAESSSPCVEDVTAIAPSTLYGEAKDAMHRALREAARENGSWAWARLFFPYGPGEAAGRFIPSVIDGLLRGTPIDCTHGRQVRDFIYSKDVAEACVALVEGSPSGAYNIGSGEGRSLREVAAVIVAQIGRGELVRFGARPAPAHDAAYVVADVSKARRDFGWSAQIGLAEGLRRTIAAHSTLAKGVT